MKKILHPLLVLLALLLILEEWLWDHLKAATQKLAEKLHLAKIEAWVRTLPPWGALLMLLAPGAVLFPFKMLALYALGNGYPVLGVIAFIAAKITGTALFAYVFELVKTSARKIGWFDKLYVLGSAKLVQVKAWLNNLESVKATRVYTKNLKQRVKAIFERDARAAARWTKKWRAAKVLAKKSSEPRL